MYKPSCPLSSSLFVFVFTYLPRVLYVHRTPRPLVHSYASRHSFWQLVLLHITYFQELDSFLNLHTLSGQGLKGYMIPSPPSFFILYLAFRDIESISLLFKTPLAANFRLPLLYAPLRPSNIMHYSIEMYRFFMLKKLFTSLLIKLLLSFFVLMWQLSSAAEKSLFQ